MAVEVRTRVVVGMSGGVDSSAAAALLLDAGYEVIGITLKLWPQDCLSRAEDKCCGPQAVTDARAVCHQLGIPYYLIDEAAEFQTRVIQYFADEYKAGRTPNPCVLCNQNLKFGRLLDRADQLGAQYIATGHFARLEKSPDGTRTLLKRGRDLRKDQSYFLFSLRQEQLARALFPLGEKTKTDTRAVARHCRLKTADKEESMEICFVPDNDYGKFLQQAQLGREASGRDRGSCRARCWATMTASSSTPSASARAWASPPRNRSMSSSWMPPPTALLSATTRRSSATNSSPTAATGFAFDTPPASFEATVKIRYNSSRRLRDGDAAARRPGQSETARPPTRRHPRASRRLLPGRPGPGRRLDHALIRVRRPASELEQAADVLIKSRAASASERPQYVRRNSRIASLRFAFITIRIS